MKLRTVAFFPNHPSQIWLLHAVSQRLGKRYRKLWFLRDKDVSLELARQLGLEFIIVSRARRGYLGNAWELFWNIFRCLYFSMRFGVDLWISKYGCANIAAFILGRKSLSFNDDDVDVVPLIAWTSYPFAEKVLMPIGVRAGRFEKKTLRYLGSHELAYLHPRNFSPRLDHRAHLALPDGERFGIIRLSALHAHHDVGKAGVAEETVLEVIRISESLGIRVFITSEKVLAAHLEPWRLSIAVSLIHHALADAEFLVGDSQTMTSESVVLGTPSFRISDFVGQISLLADLEKNGLSFGFLPSQRQKFLTDFENFLRNKEAQAEWKSRHAQFLENVEDPVTCFETAIDAIFPPGISRRIDVHG